jgi:hypothetical protein
MAPRRLVTILLLTWTFGLGLIEAGVQPAYRMRREMIPACSAGCPEDQEPAVAPDCLVVCMVWCATPGFNAVSEGAPVDQEPAFAGRTLRLAHWVGEIRTQRPPLPPPRV